MPTSSPASFWLFIRTNGVKWGGQVHRLCYVEAKSSTVRSLLSIQKDRINKKLKKFATTEDHEHFAPDNPPCKRVNFAVLHRTWTPCLRRTQMLTDKSILSSSAYSIRCRTTHTSLFQCDLNENIPQITGVCQERTFWTCKTTKCHRWKNHHKQLYEQRLQQRPFHWLSVSKQRT